MSGHIKGDCEVLENSWDITSVYTIDKKNLICEVPIDPDVTEENEDELRELKNTNAKRIALTWNMHDELIEALEDTREYFDGRADAEYFADSATPVVNEEMRLQVQIEAALAKAGAI